MTPPAPKTLGFPPSQPGEKSTRLAVPFFCENIFALEKPAGAIWERDRHNDTAGICEAVKTRVRDDAPEWRILGLREPLSIWNIETEIAGVGLFAERGAVFENLRNALGSGFFEFVFEFFAAENLQNDTAVCALPVAEHSFEKRALVSHSTGKKSATAFRRIANFGRWRLWEARTNFPRWHQVRLHAAELGFKIVGEKNYADGATISVAQILPRHRLNKGDDRPLHDGICLRLSAVECARASRTGVILPEKIMAPAPDKWRVLRKRLSTEN